jgi:hypothetical protein
MASQGHPLGVRVPRDRSELGQLYIEAAVAQTKASLGVTNLQSKTAYQ